MSEELAELLDLRRAWRHVKSDIADRVFMRHPYAQALIESYLDDWLNGIANTIRGNTYSPSPMFVCDVPKGKGLIRPGSHLSFTDRVVYAACVGACFEAIHRKLKWSQGVVDYSYRLAVDPNDAEWIRDRFVGWNQFQERSLERIRQGSAFVVIADISSFYENVDIGLLLSDLRDTGAPRPAMDQISACLNRWAQTPGRGIPQGQSPSDILAKLYLNNFDRVLGDKGYSHFRYVDDVRVFCSSRNEAKQVLIEISRLLRSRGLCLQPAKSEILSADEAREKFEEVAAVLKQVQESFMAVILDDGETGDPYTVVRDFDIVVDGTGFGDFYMGVHQADEMLEASPDPDAMEVIRDAFQQHIVDRDDRFNATLFRYLLNRLGKQRDSFAASYCVGMLEPHPEETDIILKYLGSVGPGENIEAQIVELLRSGQIVYEYQRYQIIEWFHERANGPTEALMDFVRRIAFNPPSPRYLRTVCRAFLGRFGLSSDIERIALQYDETTDVYERVEIVCAIRRLERGRRNALLGRFQEDHERIRRAAVWVRSLQ